MSDRRQPQVAALLRRLENDCPPHVHARISEQFAAALAATDDTQDIAIELPDLHGARVTIKGLPPTLLARAKARVKAALE